MATSGIIPPNKGPELAIIYFRLCGHLSKQGFIVIISAVAMLDEARRWFKQNIENGFEVYLNVPETERVNRDLETQKFIYNKASLDNSVYTPPVKPDIFINNFGDLSSQDAATVIAKKYLERVDRSTVDYGRSEYWSQFYLSQPQSQFPSPFANIVQLNCLLVKLSLKLDVVMDVMLGFFAKAGFQVVGIDKSEEAIRLCTQQNEENISYFCCETHQLQDRIKGTFDLVYSRFSLQSMTALEEDNA